MVNRLLVAVFDDEVPPQTAYAMHGSIQEYLNANLESMDLDPEQLCARFHCSRATLYRLFRDQGGVRRFLREQRLGRCFHELAMPISSDCRIRSIAEKWGFRNASHFHRLFKGKFGISPSEIREIGGQRTAESIPSNLEPYMGEIRRLQSWLRQQGPG